MPAFTFTMASGCTAGAGFVDLLSLSGGAAGADYSYELTGDQGSTFGGSVVAADLPLRLAPLPNETFAVRVSYLNPDNTAGTSVRTAAIACSGSGGGGGPSALVLDSIGATDETVALGDGTATIQASGGTAPLTAALVELNQTQPATSGTPSTFTGLPPGYYTVRVTDANAASVEGHVHVDAYEAPVPGCTDEYATTYDPGANQSDPAACSYAPHWRSAWQPMAVVVPAVQGQQEAYVQAQLFIGFRPGHPLAGTRPYGTPLLLTATVGPSGFAVFRLGPYLRPALGAPDEAAGRRLDLNSVHAYSEDLYVGYALRRTTGELLEHGYALNSAVPDAAVGSLLTPFARLPVWPGFNDYLVAQLSETSAGRFGLVENDHAYQYDTVALPCPPNPLPVAWLAPGSGYGFWVFQGKAQRSDEVEEGQTFTDAGSFERRYSERGASRDQVVARSGVFAGEDLLAGLRTLARSPQVWYQPVPGGPWVPVTIAPGSFPAGRIGVRRNEITLTFTEAAPQYVQGQ